MSKYKRKEMALKRSVQMKMANFRNIIKIQPKKDEILFGEKTFLEIILGLIKTSQNDYLSKLKSIGKINNISLIKECLATLNNNLKEIKVEKEKNLELLKNQKEQKKLNLKAIMIQSNIQKKRRINSEILALGSFEDGINEYSFNFPINKELDFKIKNFILENKLKEVENNIERINFLIKFYKIPHKFKYHFDEILLEDKKNKYIFTDILHDRLIILRDLWKEVANKKNIQEMRIDNIQAKINNLKKNPRKNMKIDIKYVNTEDIIPEENIDTEKDQDETTNKLQKTNIKNINFNIANVDGNNIKLEMKDMKELINVNMNINVNINLNQQYINNYLNNYVPQLYSKNIFKSKKSNLMKIINYEEKKLIFHNYNKNCND